MARVYALAWTSAPRGRLHRFSLAAMLCRVSTRREFAGRLGLGALGALAAPVAGCERRRPRGRITRPGTRSVSANAQPILREAQPAMDGDGARVFRLFPNTSGDHRDPFVLLDDFRVTPPSGFPMQPHRGFEACTYMRDGAFHHRDSMGNDGVVTTGGTQRFTSGRGARHSEMPAAQQVNHGLQLWVNLPGELKGMEPEYAAVQGPDIPEQGRVAGIVREVVGSASPVRLRTAVRYLDVRAERTDALHTEV